MGILGIVVWKKFKPLSKTNNTLRKPQTDGSEQTKIVTDDKPKFY